MGDYIEVYFASVNSEDINPKIQASFQNNKLCCHEELTGFIDHGLLPRQEWYCTVSRNFWLQAALSLVVRHHEIRGLEFNYPLAVDHITGVETVLFRCSILGHRAIAEARLALSRVYDLIRGGIPPLGRFDPTFRTSRGEFWGFS